MYNLILIVLCYITENAAQCDYFGPPVYDQSNRNLTLLTTADFQHIKTVSQMDFSNNLLTDVSATLFEKGKVLRYLNFNDNPYLEFPENRAFLNNSYLRKLSIGGCKIEKLYNNTFELLPQLSFLDLSYNFVTEIARNTFSSNAALEVIILSENYLKKIDVNAFLTNRKLRQLIMNHNSEYNFILNSPFLNSASLQIFQCRECGIQHISTETFAHMPNILELHLNRNAISSVPSNAFKQNIKIKEIHLEDNKLVQFSTAIFNLKSLAHLSLDGNPFDPLVMENKVLIEKYAVKNYRLPGRTNPSRFFENILKVNFLKIEVYTAANTEPELEPGQKNKCSENEGYEFTAIDHAFYVLIFTVLIVMVGMLIVTCVMTRLNRGYNTVPSSAAQDQNKTRDVPAEMILIHNSL